MVRNTKGGNKGKKIKRCRTTVQKKMRYAVEGEMYARVQKLSDTVWEKFCVMMV